METTSKLVYEYRSGFLYVLNKKIHEKCHKVNKKKVKKAMKKIYKVKK